MRPQGRGGQTKAAAPFLLPLVACDGMQGIWLPFVFGGLSGVSWLHSAFRRASRRNPWHLISLPCTSAPSKTFNLAGLVGSYHIVYNEILRRRMDAEGAATCYNNMNVLSMYALMGAYSDDGAAWLDELREVLTRNVHHACDVVNGELEGVSAREPQGTYMLFLDCTEYCEKAGISLDELLRRGHEVGVLWQDGRPFHGACHIRMNVALPYERLQEAMRRLKEYVFV